MIEMLGVLAIIGVLSAGGIFAYSTAMENYRVSKTIDDINNITSALENIVGMGKVVNRDAVVFYPYELHALGVIPDNLYKTAASPCAPRRVCYLKNLFGGRFYIEYHEGKLNTGLRKKTFFGLEGLSKSSCIKLVLYDWNNPNVLLAKRGQIQVQVADSSGTDRFVQGVGSIVAKSTVETWCNNNRGVKIGMFLSYKEVGAGS